MWSARAIEICAMNAQMRLMSDALTYSPDGIDAELRAELARLARRQHRAQGSAVQLLSGLGRTLPGGSALPAELRNQLSRGVKAGLERSYELARTNKIAQAGRRFGSDRSHKLAGAAAGAVGGAGGLASALVELPFTITLIFSAVQRVAAEYGEDPNAPETCAECLHVFAAGGAESAADALDAGLLGARLTLQGPLIQRLIAQAAPRLAALLSQKLSAQAVPLLGAAAGASVNYAFLAYYTELAHVHFGLKALARDHDRHAVLDEFHAALARQGRPLMRA